MRLRAAGPAVVSLYAAVPLGPDELRGMVAHIDKLLGSMETTATADDAHQRRPGQAAQRGQRPDPADIAAIRSAFSAHAQEWLGKTVAAFACRQLGLFEITLLPAGIGELAVAASRPYVRPMLAVLQRSPAYIVTVIDRRNAWLFRVSAEGIETVGQLEEDGIRKPRFAGWYGLEEHRVHERITQLTRHHYRRTAAALDQAVNPRSGDLLVLGGHRDEVAWFLSVLPAPLRARFAGSFVVDPHTMTPAQVHRLADGVVARWEETRERRMAAETSGLAGDESARGLEACVAAANQRAVRLLTVPDALRLPGSACDHCDALAVHEAECPVCGAAMGAVPDIVEELVVRVIEEGGNVQFIRDAGAEMIAARLRFPLPVS